ncbi:hypothetical protein BT93_A1462 [Corymbia citriodora subsp. variegata]|nr:hypothetical protein BT93_A1462 [Corymbia citriodora subsp. variegata]
MCREDMVLDFGASVKPNGTSVWCLRKSSFCQQGIEHEHKQDSREKAARSIAGNTNQSPWACDDEGPLFQKRSHVYFFFWHVDSVHWLTDELLNHSFDALGAKNSLKEISYSPLTLQFNE